MSEIKATVTINRPISEVFRYATNFHNAGEWQPDVEESHQSDEKPRVGVFITQRRSSRALGWKLDFNADIVEYVPNKLLGYKGIVGRFPVQGAFEFQPGGGTTTITERMNIRIPFLYTLFSPLISGAMRRRTEKALATLKAQLEAGSASAPPTNFHEKL